MTLEVCVTCGSFLTADNLMCSYCWKKFRLNRDLPTRRSPCFVQSLWSWNEQNEEISRSLIYALKGCREPARWLDLATLMVERVLPILDDSCLVPIPSKKNSRGDHALGFALAIGAVTGLPVNRCLTADPGLSQRGLSRRERQRVRIAKSGRLPRRAKVILVDDVVTSGATLAAAEVALMRREPLQAWCLMDRRLVADLG